MAQSKNKSKQNRQKNHDATIVNRVIKRNESVTRKDIADHVRAKQEAGRAQMPKQVLLQTLCDNVMQDALLSSQINLRIDKTQSADFTIVNKAGKTDDKATEYIKDTGLYNSLSELIIEAKFYGHSVIEFDYKNGLLVPLLIPRRHIAPATGIFYKDTTDQEGAPYRELPDFGKYILEFNLNRGADYGLLNKAIPHVLMKRFSQSCWSELCEIFGIPPRVMKTDTTSPEMLRRAEQMMREIGAAGWWIIDTSETFEFAKNVVSTDGSVYSNLMTFCNNEISMLVLGAVVGQDTKNGNESKEKSSQNLVDSVVLADQRYVESEFNHAVLPALHQIGVIGDSLRLNIQKETNIKELFDMTIKTASYFEIDPKWMKEKFGIEVTGSRYGALPSGEELKQPIDPFV